MSARHVHQYRLTGTDDYEDRDGKIVFVFYYACACGDKYKVEE